MDDILQAEFITQIEKFVPLGTIPYQNDFKIFKFRTQSLSRANNQADFFHLDHSAPPITGTESRRFAEAALSAALQ